MADRKKPRIGRKTAISARLDGGRGGAAESPDSTPAKQPSVNLAVPERIASPARASAEEKAKAWADGAAREPAAVQGLIFPGLGVAEVDALARSSVALADGAQAFGRALIEMQRHSVSTGLSAARDLVDARDLQDLMEIQRRFVSRAVEGAVRDSGGLAQLASQVASEALAVLAPRTAASADAPDRSQRA